MNWFKSKWYAANWYASNWWAGVSVAPTPPTTETKPPEVITTRNWYTNSGSAARKNGRARVKALQLQFFVPVVVARGSVNVTVKRADTELIAWCNEKEEEALVLGRLSLIEY